MLLPALIEPGPVSYLEFGSAPLPYLRFQVADPQIPMPCVTTVTQALLLLRATCARVHVNMAETGDGGGSGKLSSACDVLAIGQALANRVRLSIIHLFECEFGLLIHIEPALFE